MGLAQFGLGFGIVTVAFPFGRGLCLAMVGKLLGDRPQGAWMGVMFALGAIARIAGPFWAVTGYYAFGALAVFGSTALLFVGTLVAARVLWADLTPPPTPFVPAGRRPFPHTPREGTSPFTPNSAAAARRSSYLSPNLFTHDMSPTLKPRFDAETPPPLSLTTATK